MKQKIPKRSKAVTLEKKPIEVTEQPKASPGEFKNVKMVDQNTVPLNPDDVGLDVLEKAFGTADAKIQTHLLGQVLRSFEDVVVRKEINQSNLSRAVNIAVSILKGIQPRDEIELMLVTQMIGVHNLGMKSLSLGLNATVPDERNGVINQATKLLRTYTTQMKALKRYRSDGRQKVTVEHVHVNEGGQAIVGSVTQGGGRGSCGKN